MLKTVQWNVIIIIIIIVITIIIIIIIIINVITIINIIYVVVVADVDAYYYWPHLSSRHLFQVNCKVRQHVLLQSPGWSVITKCDSFVIIK